MPIHYGTSMLIERPFEIAVLEYSLKQSSVICFNSVELTNFVVHKLVGELAIQKNKFVIIIADTEKEVDNHSIKLSYNLNLKVQKLQKESSNTNKSHEELYSANVIVSTASNALKIFNADPVLVRKIKVAVFMDCHKVKNPHHNYNQILELLNNSSSEKQIHGLTSCLLHKEANLDEVNALIGMMESTFKCKVLTRTDLIASSVNCISTPKESILVSSSAEMQKSSLYIKIKKILDRTYKHLTECQIKSSDFSEIKDYEVVNVPTKNEIRMKGEAQRSCKDVNDQIEVYSKPLNYIKALLKVLEVLGPWSVYKLSILLATKIQSAILTKNRKLVATNELKSNAFSLGVDHWEGIHLIRISTVLRHIHRLCYRQFRDFDSPPDEFISQKVHRLLEIFREYRPSPKNASRSMDDFTSYPKKEISSEDNQVQDYANHFCSIVFVHDHYVAMMLQHLIVELQATSQGGKDARGLRHVRGWHLGSRAEEGSEVTAMEKCKREEVLHKFRCRSANMLITGDDLNDCHFRIRCNLVVSFDAPLTYNSYIDAKSKLHTEISVFIVITNKINLESVERRLRNYKAIEKVLLQSDSDLSEKVKNEIENGKIDADKLHLDSYMFKSKTMEINCKNAIKTINRYCAKLPNDTFTHIGPKYDIIEILENNRNVKYSCILQLPTPSNIRYPIQGPVSNTILRSQETAAVLACQKLCEIGALDNYGRQKNFYKYREKDELMRGDYYTSEKNKATYDRKLPRIVSKCLPCAEKSCFLYEIRMVLKNPIPSRLNVRSRRISRPENTTLCFGILTSKILPKVQKFPYYTRSGEEVASLILVKSFIKLSEQHLSLIKHFNKYLLSEVLNLERCSLTFNPKLSSNQLQFVALNKKAPDEPLDFDWQFMVKCECQRMHGEKLRKDFQYKYDFQKKQLKRKFVFDRRKFKDAVVTPMYRQDDIMASRFYVAEIKENMSPLSPFPSTQYSTFEEYYSKKYNMKVSDKEQPLIDVDHSSVRLNFLYPRYAISKYSSSALANTKLQVLEKKKSRFERPENHQILVPELCNVHPVPASLWKKAVCLPTIAHRLTQLFLCDEFRRKIIKNSGIYNNQLPFCFKWPDIRFQWEDIEHMEEKSEKCQINEIDDDIEEEEIICDKVPIVNGHKNSSDCIDSHSSNKIKSDEAVENNYENEGSYHDLFYVTNESDENIYAPTNSFQVANQNGDYCEINGTTELFSNKNDSVENGKVCDESSQTNSFPFIFPQNFYNELQKEACDIVSKNFDRYGPDPYTILTSLTHSMATDNDNYQRLEMLGDSFLKYATSTYLFCEHPNAHEGRLSRLRTLQVSNKGLYNIGLAAGLAHISFSHPFNPLENWLPCCYMVGKASSSEEHGMSDYDSSSSDQYEINHWDNKQGESKKVLGRKKVRRSLGNRNDPEGSDSEDLAQDFRPSDIDMIDGMLSNFGISSEATKEDLQNINRKFETKVMNDIFDESFKRTLQNSHVSTDKLDIGTWEGTNQNDKDDNEPLQAEMHTQHSISDKSVADLVESLVGAHLDTQRDCLDCGRNAQLLLCHLGIQVLPEIYENSHLRAAERFGYNVAPEPSELTDAELEDLQPTLDYMKGFEEHIGYSFKNKYYLVQAFKHASYTHKSGIECYQRLEFLGDAILDYLVTSYLFKSGNHTAGQLTDLRSSLVNNNLFASLAVRNGFHHYFQSVSVELQRIIDEFVSYQQSMADEQGMDAELIRSYTTGRTSTLMESSSKPKTISSYNAHVTEMREDDLDFEENDDGEDIEVPKQLGDLFESVAGAIFLDSGMDLKVVWRVYSKMWLPLIEKYSKNVPRSPVRQLFELEPETARFSKGEKRVDGKIRVTCNIIGKGTFKGVGRGFKVAKAAAARRALRYLARFAAK